MRSGTAPSRYLDPGERGAGGAGGAEELLFSLQALEDMNGKELEGEPVEIVFAKPPDQKRKERKAQRQAAKTQM